MNKLSTLILLLLLALFGRIDTASALEVRLSSQFLVTGEQALLEYVVPDSIDPRAVLETPEVDGLTIRPIGRGAEPRIAFGRRREYIFAFAVTSYEPGTYTIPSVRLDQNGVSENSEAIQLRIFRETDLEWSTVAVGDTTMRYAAAFHVIDREPFLKEVIPTELKVYIPSSERVEDWGIPEFERDGVAAWRFEPRPSLGRATLLGRPYYAVSYPSTLSPTRSGPVRIGPAKLRLVTVQTSVRDFGQAFYAKAFLDIPALELGARPLPEGAPEGFADAVGKFALKVSADETEIREGDPVSVDVIVSGTGNLDTLDCPTPIDSQGWKLYPPSSAQLSERRAITGLASFRQFMRPIGPQVQIPPFRLVYFDPEEESYVRLLSEPIPLDILPSTGGVAGIQAVPPALSMPIEEMADILGVVNRGTRLLAPPGEKISPRWWHLVPAAVALVLLGMAFRLHVMPRFHRDPVELERKRALRKLDRAPRDKKGFYRAAGHFVESWLGDRDDELTRDVLAKRDQSCFIEGVDSESLPSGERQRILRGLRRLAMNALLLLATLAFLAPADLRAEDDAAATEEAAPTVDPQTAYDEGRYAEAAAAWLESGPYEQLPADTLYNIGNAAYRLGVPGEAALYWRRALSRDATHAEARQNLRFFERKFGSITIDRPEYQYTLAKLPLGLWKTLVWAGAWLVVLALLVFPATRAGSRLRIAAVAALVSAPLAAGAGACGWYYYPDDASFAPLAERAVIISDRATVRTDAARNAPMVIDAPAGSLCRILNRRDGWIYIAFTNETRGWVDEEEIRPIAPDDDFPPEPPTLGEAPDEGRSA